MPLADGFFCPNLNVLALHCYKNTINIPIKLVNRLLIKLCAISVVINERSRTWITIYYEIAIQLHIPKPNRMSFKGMECHVIFLVIILG